MGGGGGRGVDSAAPWHNAEGLANQITVALAPTLQAIAERIADVGEWFSKLSPEVKRFAGIATAVAAVKIGATDYLSKPADATDITNASANVAPNPVSARVTNATFDASLSRWNIDSPQNRPPTLTP